MPQLRARVGATLVATGLVLAAAACGAGDDGSGPTATGSSASAPAPPTGLLAATDGRPTTPLLEVDLGGSPCGVVVAYGSVWVSLADTAELVRLDPATGEVTARLGLSATPCEITATDDSLWVATQSGVVDRVDPAGPTLVSSVPTGAASYQAAGAFGSIWVSNRNGRSLTRIDPETEKTTTVDLAGTNAGGIVEAAGALWIGDDTTGSTRILRVDPGTLEATTVEVGADRPAYLAATGDTVWVSGVRSGSVVAVDAAAGAVVGDPVPAGASPVNLHASPDGRWVWVPDDGTDYLTRIDTATGTAVERLRAGDGPAVVAPTDDGVWVTNFGDGTVWYLELAPG